jgi:phosphinothricin acetyltransferase
MSMEISAFAPEHWDAVADIYRQGLQTRNATFETVIPDYETWLKKFFPHMLWVAASDGRVVGWAGLQPVSPRKVYAGVVEVSVYIDLAHAGKGIGKSLMAHLIQESERAGLWTLYASIFPENTASIRLHRAAGFREIGYRDRIAQLDGEWRSTVLFERRSAKVGVS